MIVAIDRCDGIMDMAVFRAVMSMDVLRAMGMHMPRDQNRRFWQVSRCCLSLTPRERKDLQ